MPRTFHAADAPRIAGRLRRAVRLGRVCRKLARAEGRDPRLLSIVLRGALDGLAAVAPVGDPDWMQAARRQGAGARRQDAGAAARRFLRAQPGDAELAPPLSRPAQATIVHAAATPYRERSHFDGQDVLESGLPKPGAADTGWLNRALAALEPARRVEPRSRQAFAVGPITPLVVRGPAPVLSWAPPTAAAGERRHA